MTTIDYSKPILLPLKNGGIHKLQLDSTIAGHKALIAAIELAASEKSLENNFPDNIRKFDALSERKIIANTALTRSGLIAGL